MASLQKSFKLIEVQQPLKWVSTYLPREKQLIFKAEQTTYKKGTKQQPMKSTVMTHDPKYFVLAL